MDPTLNWVFCFCIQTWQVCRCVSLRIWLCVTLRVTNLINIGLSNIMDTRARLCTVYVHPKSWPWMERTAQSVCLSSSVHGRILCYRVSKQVNTQRSLRYGRPWRRCNQNTDALVHILSGLVQFFFRNVVNEQGTRKNNKANGSFLWNCFMKILPLPRVWRKRWYLQIYSLN
jgi:hypothetical protein